MKLEEPFKVLAKTPVLTIQVLLYSTICSRRQAWKCIKTCLKPCASFVCKTLKLQKCTNIIVIVYMQILSLMNAVYNYTIDHPSQCILHKCKKIRWLFYIIYLYLYYIIFQSWFWIYHPFLLSRPSKLARSHITFHFHIHRLSHPADQIQLSRSPKFATLSDAQIGMETFSPLRGVNCWK